MVRAERHEQAVPGAVFIGLRKLPGWTLAVGLLEWAFGISRRRQLERQLADAHAEIDALRARLAEATRPPTQFARMHMRAVAVDRFARLRLAAPRRGRLTDADRTRDLVR